MTPSPLLQRKLSAFHGPVATEFGLEHCLFPLNGLRWQTNSLLGPNLSL